MLRLEGVVKYYSAIVILMVPMFLLDVRLSFGGIILRFSDIYLIFLFVINVLIYQRIWALFFIQKYLYFVPFFIFSLLVLISVDTLGGVVEIIQWMLLCIWPVVLSFLLLRSEGILFKLRSFLMISAVYVCLWHVLNGYFVSYKFYGDAKYVFGFFFFISVVLYFNNDSKGGMWLVLLSLILMFLSMERKGILISFLSIVVFFLLKNSALIRYYFPKVLILTLCFCIASGVLLYELYIEGLWHLTVAFDEEEGRWISNLHRMNLIANGVEIFYDNSFFGVGAKNLNGYMEAFYINQELAFYTHNWYLDFLVEYGVFGSLLLFSVPFRLMLKISVVTTQDCIYASFSFYCLVVPVFMANGTTSMLLWLTAIGLLMHLSQKTQIKIGIDNMQDKEV
jgi:hypothetical protein